MTVLLELATARGFVAGSRRRDTALDQLDPGTDFDV
jgi:hypothetical protein